MARALTSLRFARTAGAFADQEFYVLLRWERKPARPSAYNGVTCISPEVGPELFVFCEP